MTNVQQTSEEEFLATYDMSRYARPSVTVDDVVLARDEGPRLRVLLVTRGGHPYRGRLALPGGFLRSGDAISDRESPEQAVVREVVEETGVEPSFLEQLATYGDVDRDPRGHVVSVAYWGCVPRSVADQAVLSGDDASDAGWYGIRNPHDGKDGLRVVGTDGSEVPCENLAFDHGRILADAVSRIEGKMLWTDALLGFFATDERFSIRDVYDLACAIWDACGTRRGDKGNFYRDFDRRFGAWCRRDGSVKGVRMYVKA